MPFLSWARRGAIDFLTVVPALIKALDDREASVRNEAALALWRYLAEALKIRGNAMIDQIRACGNRPDRGRQARWRHQLCAPRRHSPRRRCLRELKDAGVEPDKTRADDPIDPKTLVKAFSAVLERDHSTRRSLLACYRRSGQIDEPAPPALLAALDDPSRIVRIEALQAIAEFTKGVDQAVSVLFRDAESAPGESPFRQRLGTRLSTPPGCRATTSLGGRPSALDQRDWKATIPDVREVAVVLLKHLGPLARPAAPGLDRGNQVMIESVKSAPERGEDPFFSDFASAVVQIAPAEEAISVLSEALDPDHPTSGRTRHGFWASWAPRAAPQSQSCSRP